MLTRDPSLSERFRDIRVYTVTDENPWFQFHEVIREFGLALEHGPFTRCTVCNAPVTPVAKEQHAGEIPVRVYEKISEFYRCTGCGRLYWPGTHVEKMKAQLDEMREIVSREIQQE